MTHDQNRILFEEAYAADGEVTFYFTSDAALFQELMGREEPGATGTTLSVSGYQSDKNWDDSSSSGVTVSVTGYSSDKNFDSQTNSSGAVTKQEFDTDHNWQ